MHYQFLFYSRVSIDTKFLDLRLAHIAHNYERHFYRKEFYNHLIVCLLIFVSFYITLSVCIEFPAYF